MLRLRINSIIKSTYPFLLLFLMNNNLFSQNQSNASDFITEGRDSLSKVYGLDPLLYNGMIYNSFNPVKAKGDQYFSSSSFTKGEVTIRGIKYKDLDLNFDIYKEELLLRYTTSSNVYNTIMISKAWLEDFSIGNIRFKPYSTSEAPNRLYQVLGNDSIQLLYYWKKVLEYENDYLGNSNMYFNTKKELNIVINKSLKNFRNNKSFVHLFAKEKQPFIKKYLRQNKIKVTNASDLTMEELINYCSKL